jgi:protein-tyrosine phosphatase
MEQLLPVKSIANARNLGGYSVAGGLRLKDGLLLRAAHLADATDADLQYLASLNVKKVIDLRKDVEKQDRLDRTIPGAEYVSLPIDAAGKDGIGATEEERKKLLEGKRFDVGRIIVIAAFNEKARRVARDMYPTLIMDSECQQQYARLFRLVIDTPDGAILFHCTQGKDRTGIASALLLAALGASRETIVADFDFTNKIYAEDVKRHSRRVRLLGGGEEEIATVKSFIGANTDNFNKALDMIDNQFGSIENYLKGPMQLTDKDIATLRERYLTAE